MSLAPLAFGNGSALAFDSVAACTDFLEKSPGRPTLFDAVGRDPFAVKLRSVPLSGLTVVAGTSTPKVVDHESQRAAIVVPFGRCASTVRAGAREYRWASPDHAFFIPAGEKIVAESTAGSFLRIDIDERKLAAVGERAAEAGPPPALDLGAMRIVPMRAGGINWLAHVRSLCASIDALACDPAAITAAGLDDTILRSIAMMLAPAGGVDSATDSRVGQGCDVSRLVERMEACLGERITLSLLEAWSGRSARTIQMAFRRRFGMGPMRWLLNRRLDAIHARLCNARETAPIGQIARECGIHRAATLGRDYARRFGEKASVTRRRARD